MPTISINGDEVFYLEFGPEDAPPLILLHGLYGEAATVAPLAERLATSFRVIAPDALGHGRSARPDGYTLETQGRMIDGLIASLGYDAASVAGVSMGSYLAAKAAIVEPSRISHLILIVGKAHGTTSSSVAYANRMGFDLAGASPEALLEFMSGAIWSKHTSPERRQQILEWQSDDLIQLTPDEKAAVERSLAGFDLRPDLGRITAKTLIISGRDDGLNPPEAGEELRDGIPGSRFEIYEHSGHMLPFEEEDRLVAEIIEFAGS
jgi:3-oxoadipate enol-lactonase